MKKKKNQLPNIITPKESNVPFLTFNYTESLLYLASGRIVSNILFQHQPHKIIHIITVQPSVTRAH